MTDTKDKPARPPNARLAAAWKAIKSIPASAEMMVLALLLGILGAWSFATISGLRSAVDEMETALIATQQQGAALTARVTAQEKAIADLTSALQLRVSGDVSTLQQQYIGAASARLQETVAREIAALGTSGFRFSMVEFDRRSCAEGGVFSGELADGSRQNQPFDANRMVEIQESSEDVRGIPFYPVRINGNYVQSNGGRAIYRHGSMRIECN